MQLALLVTHFFILEVASMRFQKEALDAMPRGWIYWRPRLRDAIGRGGSGVLDLPSRLGLFTSRLSRRQRPPTSLSSNAPEAGGWAALKKERKFKPVDTFKSSFFKDFDLVIPVDIQKNTINLKTSAVPKEETSQECKTVLFVIFVEENFRGIFSHRNYFLIGFVYFV